MQIEILFFGITTDIVGKKSILFELNNGNSVAYLREQLTLEFPKLKDYKNYAVAINMEYAQDTSVIKIGDAIALIPPVSGG